jgi:arylsulfatase A
MVAPWIVRGSSANRPPNIVFIVSDDQGYEDLGCYGSPDVLSPRLDALAGEGVRCTDFYVTSPVCTPTRVGLLTGRHPQRSGMGNTILFQHTNYGIGLPHNEIILPHLLKSRGYVSGCFGKWHLGWAPGSRPIDRGFDAFFGCPPGAIDFYDHTYYGAPDLYSGNQPVRREGYITDLITDETIEFIERNRHRPFFAFVPHVAPHYPANADRVMQAPQEFLDMYPESQYPNAMRRGYLAATTSMDASIGRVLDSLDSLGIADNTLVIFMSDNGGEYIYGGSNRPFRGQKRDLEEGGIRVPCIVRWPGHTATGYTCQQPFMQIDFFAMALAAAGVSSPADRIIDGRNPTAMLAGSGQSPHQSLYFRYRHDGSQTQQWAIRKGRYKRTRRGLFDLEADLHEDINLASTMPQLDQSLQSEYNAWVSQL